MTGTTRSLLERLVAFPSVTGRPNGEIAAFIAGWLRDRGLDVQEVPGRDGRTGVLARCGAGTGGVLLAAHMDVVDVEGQPWTDDPWQLRESGGRLVGRGTADMKGFLACAMEAMAAAANAPLRRPLVLAVSTDEEIGCRGVHDLLPAVVDARPAQCIVGEPTAMRLVTAHKGKASWRATLRGEARHSSEAPLADNAVERAAELVLALRDRGRELAGSGCRDERFAIPHSTISVGPIRGGTALNVVPDRCTVEFEVRTVPGDQAAGLLPDLPGAELEPLAAYPGLDGHAAGFAALIEADLGTAIDFGTEAGIYAEAGIDTAVCGPGDIADAHRADESVAVEQLERCERMLARLVANLAA